LSVASGAGFVLRFSLAARRVRKRIGAQAHKTGEMYVSISDAKRYATNAQKAQPVEEKLNHIARAIYEMARALEDVERRLINME
jgi:hypothetical protein